MTMATNKKNSRVVVHQSTIYDQGSEMVNELLAKIGPRIQKQDTRYRKALEPGLATSMSISFSCAKVG